MRLTDREAHKIIWKIANDLRGSVDGRDFKPFILSMLFYRFISENSIAHINKEVEIGRSITITEKGFYILPSELFENIRKGAKKDPHLNETLRRIFNNIESSAKGTASEEALKGLFDDLDVNSNKLGSSVTKRNETLVKIMEAISELKSDSVVDAYEDLMAMYASTSGKSEGEFFTPQEVAELLAKITIGKKETIKKVYDPACGSGSILLQFSKLLGKNNIQQGFYGQEINITSYNLCRINMFLHDINYAQFQIAHGDTLLAPHHWDEEPFDAIVSNPPYSIKWEGNDNTLLMNDPRFSPAGTLAPKSKADLAFIMHMLAWLAVDGTATAVVYPGVLYRSGAEQKIRKYLIDNNYIDTVIQLPSNLFFGVSTAECIIVLKKSKVDNCTLFIDASQEFVKATNKNKLSEKNIATIVQAYMERTDKEHFCKLVKNVDIGSIGYTLSPSSYVEPADTK